MPAPTNIDAASATLIGALPQTIDQEVAFGGVVYTVWYKIVAVLGSLAAQFTAANSNPGGSSYVPEITLYESDGTTEIAVPDSLTPIQIGQLVTQTYYIKIAPNVSDIATSPLRLTVTNNPAAPVVASYILINDDGQSGWNVQGHLPGVIIDPNTGEVVNIVFPLAQGDYGDILPSGIIALENFQVDDIVFYDAQFNVITTVDLSSATDFIKIRANNSLEVFAVSVRQSGVTKFKVYDDTGAELSNDDTSLASNPRAIALGNDGVTMYYALQPSGSDLKSWNLTTNTDNGTLVAGVPTYVISDILVMDNDDLIVLYAISNGTVFARRYNSAGVLQQSYTIGHSFFPAGAVPRIGYDANGGQNAFWVWYHPTLVRSTASKIQISDGSVLETFDIDTYEEGAAGVDNPTNIFGPSNSCPIIILGTNNAVPSGNNTDETLFVSASPPADNASGLYELITGKTDDTIWTEVGVSDEDVPIP